MIDIELLLRNAAKEIEERLDTLTAKREPLYPVLGESVRYSLLLCGKRIRPFLTCAFSDLFGGNHETALTLGCALEMIHTYSLIHDDLPCMDDDDLRRGKPTNHKVFGEATATLAGDALLTRAFEVASDPCIPADIALAAVRLIAVNAGSAGMIGGQMIDMRGEREALDFDTLLQMHAKKTGALMRAACLLGCAAAKITDMSDARARAAITYADNIGLAFQIVDDCLDVTANEAELGKPIGSDVTSQKTTFLSFMTLEEAYAYARDLTDLAKKAITAYPNSAPLCALADHLLSRRS